MNTLSKDIIQEIVKHVSVKDAYMLKLASKHFSKQIQNLEELLIRKINCRLAHLIGSTRLPQFKHLLQRFNAVITGSFLIQCILDEDWQTDVDIMIPVSSVTKVELKWLNVWDFDNLLYGLLDHEDVRRESTHIYEDGHQDIVSLRSYTLKERTTKIQTCVFRSEAKTTNAFVYRHADFDICRNVYSVIKIGEDEKEYVKVATLNQICTRQTEFKLGRVVCNSMRRYAKYMNKGFTFTNSVHAFFDQICSTSKSYTVFHVKRLDETNETNEIDGVYQVLKGDIQTIANIIDFNQPRRKSGPARLIKCDIANMTFKIPDYEKIPRVVCDKKVACPVKFCFGDITHFHVGYEYADPLDFEYIFIDDDKFVLPP